MLPVPTRVSLVQRIEYKQVGLTRLWLEEDGLTPEKLLNRLAAEGWEVITIVSFRHSQNGYHVDHTEYAYLKRSISEARRWSLDASAIVRRGTEAVRRAAAAVARLRGRR